jgi:hypothetical protein
MDPQCALTVSPKPNARNLFEGPILSAVALPATGKDAVKPQLLCNSEPDGYKEKIMLTKSNV